MTSQSDCNSLSFYEFYTITTYAASTYDHNFYMTMVARLKTDFKNWPKNWPWVPAFPFRNSYQISGPWIPTFPFKIRTDSAVRGYLHSPCKIWTDSAVRRSLHPLFKNQEFRGFCCKKVAQNSLFVEEIRRYVDFLAIRNSGRVHGWSWLRTPGVK